MMNYEKKLEKLKTMKSVVIVNPYGIKILFMPTPAICQICGEFVHMSWESCEFYCSNCTMIFWRETQSETARQKQADILMEMLIEPSIQQYISKHTKMSIFAKIRSVIYHEFYKLFRKKELLTEAYQFKLQNYKYTLHIDSREQKHNIGHVHFYYGGGKNPPRSVGYKIDDLSPLDKEANKHFKNKKFQDFLELAIKWHKTEQSNGKTGKEQLQFAWNIMKNKL